VAKGLPKTIFRYGAAVLAVMAGFGLRWLSDRYGLGPYRFPAFQCAVIISAIVGGVGPGLLAVLLSTAGWAWFLPPVGSFSLKSAADIMNLVSVMLVNSVIVWAFAIARQHLLRTQRANRSQSSGNVLVRRSARLILWMDETAGQPGRGRTANRTAFGALICVAVVLLTFGVWGTFTPGGAAHFEDEAWLIPLIALAAAPALVIFSVGFLPLDSLGRGQDRRTSGRGVATPEEVSTPPR
jgi:hypothetical protein